MFPKKICGLAIIFILLLNVSVVSAEDNLQKADDFVGNMLKFISDIFSEKNKPATKYVLETDANEDEASDEDTCVDFESGVNSPVPPEDTAYDIERVYPSIVCFEQRKNVVDLHLEFTDYYESASPVYGETFTYDPQGDLNFKFFCGSKQAGSLLVSCLEFQNGECVLSVSGINEFDRIEIWQGNKMISSREVSEEEKIAAEAELEITLLYHSFDD